MKDPPFPLRQLEANDDAVDCVLDAVRTLADPTDAPTSAV
jgi:hypothetical protein